MVISAACRLESMEGKSICDGALGNLPKNAIMDAISKGEYIFSGSREFVLFLAHKCPTPSVVKAKKAGWWATERIFYGFFEHKKFTKLVVPTADGFNGSHEMHMFAGTCKDASLAMTDGPLEVRAVPCACPPCMQLRFQECKMRALHQCKVKHVKAPRAAGETAALKQMESLEAWSASLKSRQLVAVRADKREQNVEGLYWLAVLCGKPFAATREMLHATDRIQQGWLVVKAKWLKLEKKDCEGGLRAYSTLDAEVLLLVNHMVRLSGLAFAAGKGGPAGRELRAPAKPKAFDKPKGTTTAPAKEAMAKLVYIGKETHYSIEACCDESQTE